MTSRPWAYRAGATHWRGPAAGFDPGYPATPAAPAAPAALRFHRSLPGYRPTPLRTAPAELARQAEVGRLLIKDESSRLGLPAFKILGASWAVNCALSGRHGRPPADSLDDLRALLAGHRPTLVTATDGNHGRAVARMASLLGLPARIYLPAGVGETARRAISEEGAEVIDTETVYDGAVALAAASCGYDPHRGTHRDGGDQVLLQDTAWPGYTEVPQRIVDGYRTLFAEADDQYGGQIPDLVIVPTGVGSLLQAALEHYRAPDRLDRPAVLAVEPVTAACVTASLAAGEPVSVDTSVPTIMAGLNCGTVSTNAWPAIAGGLDAGVGVTEEEARSAVADLAAAGIPAGPCGAAGLAGLRAVTADPSRRSQLGLAPDAVVVLICTESATANPPDQSPA